MRVGGRGGYSLTSSERDDDNDDDVFISPETLPVPIPPSTVLNNVFGTGHSSPMATEITRRYTTRKFEILLHVTQTITSKFMTCFVFVRVF